jgi:tetratricopeptide (TPR) repeat protein
LQTEIIPAKLKEFIHNKVEGNPFYIEEVINSLIESKVLVQDNDGWQVFDEISNTELSSTINGVISSRLDHLEKESKRILQEESVIGRSFYYDIIKRITALNSDIDVPLSDLERLDFIKAKYFQQDIEYFFKHALTQEVVYNGLLKKERRSIHNKIGLVIEYLFKNRLAEFYETLAYHFTNGENVVKAVDYLIKSGEKSLQRYSLGEAHQYFNQAFDILQIAPQKIEGANEKIIDLLNKWSFVYYYTGEFRGHDKLLSSQKETASRVENDEIVGMYYAWNGLCLWTRNKYKESYEYLEKAKNIGETTRNPKVTGYAYTWLSWVCAELGLFDKGLEYGNIANKIARSRKADHYLYFKSLAGVAYNHLFIGSVKECINIGKKLIEYGNIHSQVRCLVLGYLAEGWGYLNAGDMILAGKAFKKSVEVSVDPFYLNLAKTGLATAHLSRQNFEEAEKEFNAVVNFCTTYGCENMNTFAKFGTGVICIGNGKMSKGMQIIEKAIQDFKDQDRMGSVSFYEFGLASLYLEMVKGTMPVNLLTILKNIGFICKNVPFAAKKAELQLKNSIRNSESIGAMGIVGQAYLGLGILHQLKKRNERAQNRFSSAIQIFKKTGAYIFLKQAKESLESLEQ